MIIRVGIFLMILLKIGTILTKESSKERNELSISECAVKMGECDETRGRPVCGTDDQTYPTRCHLLRVQCSGHQVSLKYRGPCKVTKLTYKALSACKEAREYALRHKSKNPNFVPNCKADGTYAAVQCLVNTGCWCSDITGKPIENTSIRLGKPKCREFIRANKRRSPARQLNRSRRTCTQNDRITFNANLMNVFRSEYIRSGQQAQSSAPHSLDSVNDNLVLDWKFAQLDANNNRMLDKNEFRELKKLVKRAVKPRRCGRAFGKICDVEADDRLSHLEWSSCLAKASNIRHEQINYNAAAAVAVSNHHSTEKMNLNQHQNQNQHQFHLTSRNNHRNTINHETSQDELESGSIDGEESDENSQQQIEYDEDYDNEEIDEDDDTSRSRSMLHSRSSMNYSSIYFLNPKSESSTKESDGESDCWADQAAALEEQNHGGTRVYVPECMPDGRYQRVQCYRSTPYCWCVNEDTGKNIPGTSVKDKRPQCDDILPAVRPMKGCSEPRKTMFLKELKEFLKTQILSSANIASNSTKWNSEDERIATLSFVFLDKNKNKAWERKEWKVFRELVTSSKNLRKCGKKMPRYCDINSDKKISFSEWISCLKTPPNEEGTTQKSAQSNETVTSKSSRRVGSNPLEQYLKD